VGNAETNKGKNMKKMIIALSVLAVAGCLAQSAQAGERVVVRSRLFFPAPVVYAPVCVPAPVVYAPRVVLAPPPVFCAPVVYPPQVVIRPPVLALPLPFLDFGIRFGGHEHFRGRW
jgi:hypothetical protein